MSSWQERLTHAYDMVMARGGTPKDVVDVCFNFKESDPSFIAELATAVALKRKPFVLPEPTKLNWIDVAYKDQLPKGTWVIKWTTGEVSGLPSGDPSKICASGVTHLARVVP